MDNLTHSLIGLIAGEALARVIPQSKGGLEPETRRGMFMTATVIGGNLPDLDLVYSYRGRTSNPLTYLLQHRGYTHTIIGCLILALLLYGAIEAWRHRRGLIATRGDHLALLGVALIGTALHLVMDALNSYGVHPFWPVQNRWVYGDSVYIVEPLYWAATAPLIFLLRTRIARLSLALVLVGAVAASIGSGLVPPLMYLGLTSFICLMLVIGWRRTERTAALSSVAAFVLITACFITAGQIAARRVEALAGAEFPTAHMIDHVLTPMPADPLCWDVLVLQTLGDRYVSRHAVLALAPAWIPASQCKGALVERRTLVPQMMPTLRDATSIRWKEFSMSKATLLKLVASHCDAAALMRFARAPFAIPADSNWLLGDLRFDQRPKPGLSDVTVSEEAASPAQCPWTPPWEPPRQDILGFP